MKEWMCQYGEVLLGVAASIGVFGMMTSLYSVQISGVIENFAGRMFG